MDALARLQRFSIDARELVHDAGSRTENAVHESPTTARRTVEEEYAPLLEDDNDPDALDTDVEDTPGESLPPRARKLELVVIYLAFLTLGATILLPWNAMVVAQSYFHARLIGSPWDGGVASWVALVFTGGNFLFLAHANYTQQSARPLFRIIASITTIGIVLILLCLSTLPPAINQDVFFFVLLLLVAIASAGASYLQNAVVALSALFGPSYLQGILSGQGLIGFVVSIVQLLAAIGSESSSSDSSYTVLGADQEQDPLERYADSIRRSSFIFFIVASAMTVFSLLCHFILIRLPFYRLTIRGAEASRKGEDDKAEEVDLWVVERKIRVLGLAVFWIFFVTLSVFPAITASILSVHEIDENEGLSLFSPTVFVPLGFVVFNLGDWMGRAAPQWSKLRFASTKALVACSAVRVVFVPLFLLCNVTGVPGGREPYINSDTAFFLILLFFAFSNGWLSTLIMIAGVELESLRKPEVDVAATALAFYLTGGLAAGSLASFAVRAAVCRCNPFLSS